jgi:hypothetical protein
LANIYESGELTKEATISILEIVQMEYEQFRIEQDKKYISDLDRALEKAKSKK